MLKAGTNHLSSCEESQKEDLHMIFLKHKTGPHLSQPEGESRMLFSLSDRSPLSVQVLLPTLANLSSAESKELFCQPGQKLLLRDPK